MTRRYPTTGALIARLEAIDRQLETIFEFKLPNAIYPDGTPEDKKLTWEHVTDRVAKDHVTDAQRFCRSVISRTIESLELIAEEERARGKA